MPTTPNMPNVPGGGWRQEQAARLRSQANATARTDGPRQEDQSSAIVGDWHTMQEGETLEDLASRCGQSEDAIWNHARNERLRTKRDGPEALAVGDKLYIPAEAEQPPQPVGQGEHVVKQGECISSIAKDAGHFWETIWNDPANAELKEVRKEPNVLLAGDRVTIPERRRKEEPRETEQRHRFVRRGEPTLLRLRVLRPPYAWNDTDGTDEDDDYDGDCGGDDGEHEEEGAHPAANANLPWANAPYVLEVDEEIFEGITDADGFLEASIPTSARKARMIVGPEHQQVEFFLALGSIDPITELRGLQQRLNNLGYACGPNDGILGPRTRAAIGAFQNTCNIAETERSDQATQSELLRRHGS